MTSFTLLFVALQVMGFIDWPWFYVILPSLIDVTLFILCVVIYILVAFFCD